MWIKFTDTIVLQHAHISEIVACGTKVNVIMTNAYIYELPSQQINVINPHYDSSNDSPFVEPSTIYRDATPAAQIAHIMREIAIRFDENITMITISDMS